MALAKLQLLLLCSYLGTCLPAMVSAKKVLKESSATPKEVSVGMAPSGPMPCSRQNSSHAAEPIWHPAWPTWMLITSRIVCRLCVHTAEKSQCLFLLLLNFCGWLCLVPA